MKKLWNNRNKKQKMSFVSIFVLLIAFALACGPIGVRPHEEGASLVLIYIKLENTDYHPEFGLASSGTSEIRSNSFLKKGDQWTTAGYFEAFQNVAAGQVYLATSLGHQKNTGVYKFPVDLVKGEVKPNTVVFLGYYTFNGFTKELRKCNEAEMKSLKDDIIKRYSKDSDIPLDDMFPIISLIRNMPDSDWAKIAKLQYKL